MVGIAIDRDHGIDGGGADPEAVTDIEEELAGEEAQLPMKRRRNQQRKRSERVMTVTRTGL